MVSAYDAWDATGGAIDIADGAQLEMQGTQLWDNDAGVGLYESASGAQITSEGNRYARAAHIDCAGRAILDSCTLSSSDKEFALPFIVGRGAAQIRAVNCSFSAPEGRSAPNRTTALRLVGDRSQALIRGSIFSNATIDTSTQLESQLALVIVNSTFEPPLGPSASPLLCAAVAAVIAGERPCDARAACEPVASGGVRCSCAGHAGQGLRPKVGTLDNGQQCEQDSSMRATLESESVTIAVSKLGGLANRTLNLIVEARGETEMNILFNVTMTHRNASSGAVTATNNSLRVDQPSISAFGLHLEWKQPQPEASWRADLDGSQLKFADTLRHEFTVRLACQAGEQSCAADGDDITTVVQLASSRDSHLRSEAQVVTHVQSLLSCLRTQVHTDLDFEHVSIATPIRIKVFAIDVDNLPVKFTRAEIDVVLGVRPISLRWNRGSNEYVADAPAELLSQPGSYELKVTASNASQETGPAAQCVLLRRVVIVKEGLSTIWIMAGAGGSAILVLGGLVVLARKRHAHLQAIMVMLFTEVRAIQYH